MENVIIAPHPDDEIIGCLEVLGLQETTAVCYPDIKKVESHREVEARNTCEHFRVCMLTSFAEVEGFDRYYFPDPIYEVHPKHRYWGMIGEQFLREGKTVIFYSVNMLAPYIHEVDNAEWKRSELGLCYPSQRDLWGRDSKYFLFEGYCQWLMRG